MNLDFVYQNPTTMYFGKNAIENLTAELANYGETIMLAYGKGAIKKMGLYDQILEILKECGNAPVDCRFDGDSGWIQKTDSSRSSGNSTESLSGLSSTPGIL